ncbi:HS12A-like protein [Mya arenaria]|uniref:HS12A-like protein n=1 Tax=Mya arenaria TaxID=6604 RepID=A0ABY7DBD8_MYAAR|nr:HS12A-like protein [Mya arenaria]
MGVCASLNSTIKTKGDDEKTDVESGDIGEIKEGDNEDTVSAGSNERSDIDDIYVTVAIDIGTSYSGYSFCFKDAWMGFKATTEPEEKVPTVLLLNPDETLNSFGHDAITTFNEMDEVNRRECFYITNFKLCLYRVSKLSFQTTLKAGNKHINAMHVFSLAIKHFMTMACDTIFNHSDEQSQVSDINEENVDWILTVPSIWTDSAREFMLESAKKAGIMPEKLRIVLASEAAAIYFRENELLEMVPESEEETGTTGFKYIMADIGGGVVDVCVHEVLGDQRIRELYMSTGGDIGSSAINSAYLIFLESLVGREIWTEFRTLHRKSYLDIINNYEQVKRTFSMTNDESLRLLLNKELAQTFSRKTGKRLKTVVSANFTDDSVRLSEDEEKLFINQSLMELFFCPAVDDILGKINKVLVECNDPDLSTLVLSGGFAESPYLQERLQNNLQIETMLVVKNAW